MDTSILHRDDNELQKIKNELLQCNTNLDLCKSNKTKKIREPKIVKVKEPKTKKIREPKIVKVKEPKTKKIREPKEKQNKTMKKQIMIENTKSPLKKERLNEKLINIMEQLEVIMNKKGEIFKGRAYKKAQETIMSFNEDITNSNQLKGKPNIGETIISTINEFIETGTNKLIEKEKENPENIFSDIYGIGPKKAKEIVEKNIKTIDDLRKKQDNVLNDIQKIGLKYYEDIIEKIPRTEIDEYNELFKEIFDKIKDDDSKYEIVGSYRRGAKQSGDIDIIITSGDNNVFKRFIDILINEKIIIEVLSRGKTKCLVITKIPSRKHARRVDFLYTTPDEYPFSVLYFTGSKGFNTVMRGHSLKMGYSLNEHELTKMNGKVKGEKINQQFKNEKDIFEILNLKYKEPNERIDGRAVELKDGSPVQLIQLNDNIIEPEQIIDKENKIEIKQKTRKIRIKKNIKTDEINNKPELLNEFKKTEEHIIKPVLLNENDNIINLLNEFKKTGITVLENLSEKRLSELLLKANDDYYNETPLLTDNQYDVLKEYIEQKYPKNDAITKIGAPVERNKVKLPYEMASMDKIKPDTNALYNWEKKYSGPYVLSCKLDGVSGMYSTEGEIPKLYTRGDGKIGQDISHLIPLLKLPNHKNTVVRGEFIIPKKIFNEKYKDIYANPRNLVSGIINAKTTDDKVRDLHFVAYEVIKPLIKPSEQMNLLNELRHEVVLNDIKNKLTNELLSDILLDWRNNYEYEIDGVIVIDDKIYNRSTGNPDYAFAFKMVLSDQIAEAKVIDVIWSASKDGYLKPRVRIEPIKLGGVKIEYATGFNGKFIYENKIGIGALIQIIRSGDVIPYIKSVSQPADEAKMPDISYKWTDTRVDIILENKEDDLTVREKKITAFFNELEIDGLSGGNVKRIIKAGFDTIPKILKMEKNDYEKVEGFKEKMIEKVFNGIKEKINNADLLQIMVASNMLGRGLGKRKIQPILEKYPNILLSNESAEEKIKLLQGIEGIGKENANSFVINIPNFLQFIKDCDLEYKLSSKPNSIKKTDENIDKTNILYGKKIVMTKIRDKPIIEYLQKVGATLEDSIKKDTFVLIVKSKDDESSKTKYAKQNNIPIMDVKEFTDKFLL